MGNIKEQGLLIKSHQNTVVRDDHNDDNHHKDIQLPSSSRQENVSLPPTPSNLVRVRDISNLYKRELKIQAVLYVSALLLTFPRFALGDAQPKIT